VCLLFVWDGMGWDGRVSWPAAIGGR
jgi:hypothetical protein